MSTDTATVTTKAFTPKANQTHMKTIGGFWKDIDAQHRTKEEIIAKLREPGFQLTMTTYPGIRTGANVSNQDTRENYALNVETAIEVLKEPGVNFIQSDSFGRCTIMRYGFSEMTPQRLFDELRTMLAPTR